MSQQTCNRTDSSKCNQSDPEAPGEFSWQGLEEHRTSLQRFLATRCPDENDINDIIQESFLRAARYRRGPMDAGRMRGWLMRIASNVQVDKVRRRSRGPTTGLDKEVWENLGEQVQEEVRFAWGDGELVMDEALHCLQVAEEDMREQDRKVLRDYYLERLGSFAIARRLGVSPSMVKVRLFRARRRLRNLIERQFRLVEHPLCAWA